MPFTLEHIVPWGRSLGEYRRMFSLTAQDFSQSIVACADGPASFNVEATQAGINVVSCDPLYALTTSEIKRRIGATFRDILDQTSRNRAQFVWTEFESVEQLGQARLRSMHLFLEDFDIGLRDGRYRQAELPVLPFEDDSFKLALCSHFLFLYSDQLNEAFHLDAIREMCRVAEEVRIFPLLALDGTRSPYVETVKHQFHNSPCHVAEEQVPYEFQRGGNTMLRIRRLRI